MRLGLILFRNGRVRSQVTAVSHRAHVTSEDAAAEDMQNKEMRSIVQSDQSFVIKLGLGIPYIDN